METISETLCEVCGLKPELSYEVKGKVMHMIVPKDWVIQRFSKFKNKQQKSVFKVVKVHKNYVNFENPNNFVKLYEGSIGDRNIGEYVHSVIPYIVDVQDFIKAVIKVVSHPVYLKSRQIKNFIRKTDWE